MQAIYKQKEIPEYATHGPLNNYYFSDEASRTRHTQSPNEKKSKVATSLLRRSCPVGTRGSRALHHETRLTKPRKLLHEARSSQFFLSTPLFAPSPTTLFAPSPLHSPRSKKLHFSPLLSASSSVSSPLFVPSPTTRSSASTHALFVARGPASLARLLLSSHAPSGRASTLSANRESGHASCSST